MILKNVLVTNISPYNLEKTIKNNIFKKKKNMSVIKDLKNNPDFNFNLVEYVQDCMNISDKTKYVELFTRTFSNKFKEEVLGEKLVTNTVNGYELDGKFYTFNLNDKSPFKTKMYDFYSQIFNMFISLSEMNEFVFLNERGLITENDLTSIKNINDIKRLTSVGMLRYYENQNKKNTFKIHEDDKWVIVRPLSYESSLKYGAHTSWCTSSRDNEYTFYSYTNDGILIYCINKVDGKKFAIHKTVNVNDLTFWNEKDKKCDSFFSGIPGRILEIIKDHFDNYNISNKEMCDEEGKKQYEKYFSNESLEKCCDEQRGGQEVCSDVTDSPGLLKTAQPKMPKWL